MKLGKSMKQKTRRTRFPVLREGGVRHWHAFIDPVQFRELLKQLPAHLHPLMIFLYTTGCRIGTARQIAWDMVSTDCTKVLLPERITKNLKPLPLKLAGELTGILNKRFRTGTVFDTTNLRRAWANATAAIGRPELMIYDLRRSFIRNLLNGGTPVVVVMRICGFKTVSFFRVLERGRT